MTNPLSQREIECLEHLSNGNNITTIAQCLGITESTVKTHLNRAAAKLKTQNKIHIVAYALQQHYLFQSSAQTQDIIPKNR